MRARDIKPGFFSDEKLLQCSFGARILFAGLWCVADREGRFLWKPNQIRVEVFPDQPTVDVITLLGELSLHGLTCKYIIDKQAYGCLPHFKDHQNPHPHEAKSKIPPFSEEFQCHDISPLHVMTSCHDMSSHVITSCNDISPEAKSKIPTNSEEFQCHDISPLHVMTSCHDMSSHVITSCNDISPEAKSKIPTNSEEFQCHDISPDIPPCNVTHKCHPYSLITKEIKDKDKDNAQPPKKGVSLPDWFPPASWEMFLSHRKAKRAPIAKGTEGPILKKFEKWMGEGYSPEFVVETIIERGWQSFKPEWLKNSTQPQTPDNDKDFAGLSDLKAY